MLLADARHNDSAPVALLEFSFLEKKKKNIFVLKILFLINRFMQDIGHWHFFKEFEPENWVGFVYRITHIDTGRQYIGKKFFWKTIRKPVKNRKNRRKVTKPSDWKKYTGSSQWLNSEIALHGKDKFQFDILSLHESRATLAYREVELLVTEQALRAHLPDGSKKFYNGLIPPIKFSPGVETDIEKQFKT